MEAISTHKFWGHSEFPMQDSTIRISYYSLYSHNSTKIIENPKFVYVSTIVTTQLHKQYSCCLTKVEKYKRNRNSFATINKIVFFYI